ncbi:diaminopimelate epimerase [Acrasis kona]|uniref:Diaminopimelate epimerase n=1 Tax=Acrasis kona TaxID=1008807 RepID=A0AAW2YX91_9EUKA
METQQTPGIIETEVSNTLTEKEKKKLERKAHKKDIKQNKRAARNYEDSAIEAGRKPCTLCGTSCDVLIRCQIDESETWHMTCTKCWNEVSGGVVDGASDKEFYKYGGIWKNHKADVTGKKPKRKEKQPTLNSPP